MNDFSEAAVTLTVSALVLMLIFGAAYFFAEQNCHSQWDRSGFAVEFGLFKGCMIQRKDGTWIPAKNYREI